MSLLKSRKFKLTLGAVLGIVATAISGEITWSQAIWSSMPIIAANIFGIAIEDYATKSGGA